MKIGDKIKLVSFKGTDKPKRKVLDSENYWRLIGETGRIEKDPNQTSLYANFSRKPRVLVRFDKDVLNCGLIDHNSIENSLWILVTDLEILQ